MKKEYYSHGKLLLTGEYTVLDGATALAIPTVYGQSLSVASTSSPGLIWKSMDQDHQVWFHAIVTSTLDIAESNDDGVADSLHKILKTAKALNPDFLRDDMGLMVNTLLNFPRNWGLGTSSTLINNIAQWAQVNPFQLLEESFGGSGYDIAVARSTSPLLYTRTQGEPMVEPLTLPWDFKDRLFFIHLNKKQDSKVGIARYKALPETPKAVLDRISAISRKVAGDLSLDAFIASLNEHEAIISELLRLPTVKEQLFPDYPGVVKSLGAWGGDFVLASGDNKAMEYFRKKGYPTQIPFSKMLA